MRGIVKRGFFGAVTAVAGAKVLLALAAIASARVQGPVIQSGARLNSLGVSALLVLSYAVIGLLLPRLSPADARARELGLFLLLIATSFTRVLLASGQHFGVLSAIALRLRVDVFLPVVLWMFVRDFPIRAPLGPTGAWPSRLLRLSAVVCSALFVVTLVVDLQGAYWPVSFLLMMPAAPVLIDRGRHVGPGDRRRVQLFVVAFAVGLLPIALDVVLRAASQTWRSWSAHAPLNWFPSIVLAALLSVPVTTAYSVIVDRVLDLRLMARTALQYALARSTLLALVLIPVLWAAWSTFQARSETIVHLVSAQPLPLTAAFLALIVVLPTRQRLFNSLDRQFFREQYDTETILAGLVQASRGAQSVSALADVVRVQLDRALHPQTLAVLVRRDESARFETIEGASRSLATSSMLAAMLGASDDPLAIEPHDASAVLRRLDSDSAAWVADGDFRMLVPLRGASGVLRGFIALGEKKSELRYSRRDQQLLTAVGATAGLCLDGHLADAAAPVIPADTAVRADVALRECPACGLVFPPPADKCTCGGRLEESRVPEVLAGKFKPERRIGSGGMGVVYRATDLTLGRTVAVKALRNAEPREAWRLRREARTMALITHPNLALLFGLEFWYGRPFLVVEYLAGGTLANRLAGGHGLPEEQVARIGLTLVDVLRVLHASGMLHQDIKPGNIGFTIDGVIKLLDFGLARQFRVTGDARDEPSDASTRSGIALHMMGEGRTPSGIVVGTPSYMSPEALANERPDAGFDLWSLAVTLFEAMVGVNPFRGRTMRERLVPQAAPDPRAFGCACTEHAAAFFTTALAPDRAARPATAESFAASIKAHFSGQVHQAQL